MGMKTWLDGQISIPLLRAALRLDATAKQAEPAPAPAPAEAGAGEKPKRRLALPFLGRVKRAQDSEHVAEQQPRRKLRLAFRLPLPRRRQQTAAPNDDVLDVFREVGVEPVNKAPLATPAAAPAPEPKGAAMAEAKAPPAAVNAVRTVEEPKLVPWRMDGQPQAGNAAAAPGASGVAAPPAASQPGAVAPPAPTGPGKAPAPPNPGQSAAAADPLGDAAAPPKASAPVSEEDEDEEGGKGGDSDLLDLFTDETGGGSDLKDLAATLEELDIKELLELCREVAEKVKARYGR